MICISNIACLLLMATVNVANYPMLPIVRSSCRAPAGVWRLGNGRFGEFAFGERLTSFSQLEMLTCVQTNGEKRATVKMQEPYFGFGETRLHFDNMNRLFKVEMRSYISPDEMATQTALRMSKIRDDLSRLYKAQFKKKESTQEIHAIDQYLSEDSDFIISLVLSRCGGGKALTLCVESIKIRTPYIQRPVTKVEGIDVEI